MQEFLYHYSLARSREPGGHDENGEIYTVRYDAVNAMLLNEFLKEHKTVQEQGATIARLKGKLKR